MKTTVGSYIKKYIQLNATNQREISRIMGISPTYLCEVVKGNKDLSVKVAYELSRRLKGFSARKVLYLQINNQLIELKDGTKDTTNGGRCVS